MAVGHASAADRIWSRSAGNNASNGANWVGGVAPATGDHVIFGSTTPTQACYWDLSGVELSSLTITGTYTGTLVLTSDIYVSSTVDMRIGGGTALDLNGRTFHVGGDWWVGDIRTTSTVAGSAVRFYGTEVSKIVRTTAGPARFNGLIVQKDADPTFGVKTLSDLEVSGDFSVLASSLVAVGRKLIFKGDLSLQSGYLDAETSTVAIQGTTSQTFSKNGGFNMNTLGPLWIVSTHTVRLPAISAWVFIATQPGTAVQFQSGATSLFGSFTVNGQSAGGRIQLVSSQIGSRATLGVLGAVSVTNAYVRDLDGSGGGALSATSSVDGGNNASFTVTGSPALKTWSYGGVSPAASLSGNWSPAGAPSAGDTVVFGNTTPSSPCTWDLSVPLSSFSITGSYASTVTLAVNVLVSSTVRIDAGANAALDLAGLGIYVQGDWLTGPARTTSTVAGGVVTLYGAYTSQLLRPGGGLASMPNLVIQKAPDRAVRVGSDMEALESLSIQGGTLAFRGRTQHILGDLTVGAVYIDVEGSTIVLRGSRPQTVSISPSANGSNLSGIFVQNPTSARFSQIGAAVFVATQPGTSIYFPAGASVFFSSFNVNGQSASGRIQLASTDPGTRSSLSLLGFISSSYTFVRDLEATALPVSAFSGIDGGNNAGFTFYGTPATKSWSWGGGSSLASVSGNWSPAGAPGAGDNVVFGGATPSASCQWDLGIGLSSWTMTSFYTGTVTLSNDIVITSGVRVDGGTLDLNGRRMDVRGDFLTGSAARTWSAVGGSTVAFYGPGTSVVGHTSGGTARFNHVISRKDVGTRLISDHEVKGDLHVDAGSYTIAGYKGWMRGDVLLASGFVDLAGSTVVFAGSAPQAFVMTGQVGGTTPGGVHVQNASTVTIPALGATVLVATTPASTIILSFPGPVAYQTFTVNGQSAFTRVKLRSANPGSAQRLDVSGTANVQYADVKDVDSSGGIGIVATGSVDRGNNTNWTFPIAGMVLPSSWTVVVSSLTARWDSTYPPAVQYTAQLSSGPWPNSFSGNQSSDTFNLQAGFTGLYPNTTYYLRVSTQNGTFTTLNSSATYPNYLSGVSITQVASSSITVSWTGLPASPPDASSKTALGYILQASANPDFSGTVYSSATTSLAQTSLAVLGLSQETTYYLRVGGIARLGGILTTGAAISTMTPPGLPPGCGAGYEVGKTGMPYSTLAAAVAAVPSSLTQETCVVVRDLATYSEQVTVQGKASNGFRLRILTHPSLGGEATVNPPTGSTAAFHILNSSVAIENVAIITTNTVAFGVLAASDVIRLSNVSIDSGGRIWGAGAALAGQAVISASSVTVQNADALRLSGTRALITASSFTSAGSYGLYSWFPVGPAPGVRMADSVVQNSGGLGLFIQGIASNEIRRSSLIGTWNYIVDGGSNLIEGSVLRGSTYGMEFVNGGGNVVRGSSVTGTGGAPGLYFSGVNGSEVSGCYIEGSTAVVVTGSNNMVVDSSHLVGTGASGSGLWLTGASSGLRVSSNTIRAASAGAGIRFDAGSAGVLAVSTNTIRAAGRYGIHVSSPAGGAQVWITSNTVLPSASAANDVYGLFLDGLANGATVQDNGLYFRTAGSMGGFTAFGLFARSSAGILIKRNRVSQPNVLTAASYEGVRLQGVTAGAASFNDFSSSGAYVTAALLRLMGSTATVRNNVFSTGFSVTGSSAALMADAVSGVVSDYNDYYNSGAGNPLQWGPRTYTLAAWTAATGRDVNSMAVDPAWADPSAGTEDFHPRSPRGRYDPASGSFVFDLAISSTIDAGDPAESFAAETGGDNTRVNLGSYGNTAEASRSARAPGAVSFAAVYASSVTLAFGAVGSDGYQAQLGTSLLFLDDLSSGTANPASTALTVDTLTPNSTYYARVGALYNGSFYAYTAAAGSTMTRAATPASAAAALYFSSASLSWSAGGNPVGTVYWAEVSTDSFATLTASSRTLNASALFTGLWPNTTQQFRVRAQNGAGTLTPYATGQASTLALAVSGAQLYRAYQSSLTVNWVPRPSSPPDASSMTAKGYRLEASTAPDFSGTVFSSQTVLVTLSTLTVTGLSNATYYLRVGALNWGGAPAFASAGSTRTVSTLPGDCPAGFVVRQDGSADHTSVQDAVTALPSSFSSDACVVIADSQTYAEQVTVEGKATNGFRLTIMGNRAMSSTGTVIDPPAGSTAAFVVRNASVTITNLMIRPTSDVAYGVFAASPTVWVTTAVVTGASSPWLAGLSLSSGALVDRSSVSVGAGSGVAFDGLSAQLLRSTVTAYGAAGAALLLDGARATLVADSWLRGGLYAARLMSEADGNTLTRTTATAPGGGAGIALEAGSSGNTIDRCYAQTATGQGFSLGTDCDGNLVWRSTAVATGAGTALSLVGASSNTVRASVLRSGGTAGSITVSSHRNVVAGSTFAATGSFGLTITGSSSNTVVDSYMQGSTALDVSGAVQTRIGGSRLFSIQAAGNPGLQASGGSGLSVSSSALWAGDAAAALWVNNVGGLVEATTNTMFGMGPQLDSLGGEVYLASNTVVVRPQSGTQVWALRLFNLTASATIYNNGFFFRSAGGDVAYQHYGFDVQNCSSLVLAANRLSQRSMISAGSFRAARFSNSTGVRMRNNDILATGTGLVFAALVDLQSSTVAITNNVFLASFTVSGSSASLMASFDSGLVSDYNDWYSSNSFNAAVWGPGSAQFSSGWLGQDGGSIALPPRWNDPAGEDFHPRSARGRYDPAAQSFVIDPQTSPTIDRGDPADGFALETSPNGGRVNQGSYGGTAEASRSAGAPGSPVVTGVSGSSATVSWTPVAADGYRVEAATASDFSGTLVSSTTSVGSSAQLSPQSLSPNTTYYLRVGALYGAQYEYAAATPPSTATLAHLPLSPAAQTVQFTTASVAWGANGNPAGTRYEAHVSTDLFFGSYVSSSTLAASATFYALTANATYYFRVRAVGRAVPTAYAGPISSVTSVSPPVLPSAVVRASSASLTWGGGGNIVGTLYTAELSTDAFATLNFSSVTLSTTAVFGAGGAGPALRANTTHYLRARSAGHAGPTPWVAASSAATTAADPSALTVTLVGQSSVTLSWSANGNPTGTRYNAQASTDSFATISVSSLPLSAGATLLGLQSNTTYYLRVQTLGHAGSTAFVMTAATATDVAAPAALPPSLVAAASFRSNWSANGNGPSAYYEAQLSTDSFSTLNASSVTYNVFADFAGLTSNTTYYTRARAVGYGGPTGFVTLPTTTTLLLPPAAAPLSFTGVGRSSVAVAWTSGGNGPGTVFEVQLSSDGFASVNATSSTLSLSALFGTGGYGPALWSAHLYSARARTVGGGNASAYVPLGSTVTLPVAPATPFASPVSSVSATLVWSGGSNGPAALYQAEVSTDDFATLNAASATYATSAAFYGLQPNTTHQLRVRASDAYGRVTGYVLSMPTATAAAAPVSPAAAVFTSSAAISWSVNGNPAGTEFDVRLSTDSFATVNASLTAFSSPVLFGTGGIGPALRANTTYYLSARAWGHGGSFSASASTVAVTPAATPGPATLGSVYLSSMSLSWTAGGNPAGGMYEAQASTDSFATVSASSRTLAGSATFFSLVSNATYYLRARAVGHDGAPTAFSASVTSVTVAAAPTALPPLWVQATSAAVAWGISGNALDTLYQAQASTDAFATVSASSATRNAYAAFLGLQANTTHYFRVRAVGRSGGGTAFAALPSTMTALLSPAAAGTAFPTVGVSSLAVQWASGGNGPGTVYEAQISTDGFATVKTASSTLSLSAVFGTGGAGPALLGASTFYARVRAVSGSSASGFVSLSSTWTRADLPMTPFVLATTSATAGAAWGPMGNGPGAAYRVQASLDSFASVAAASVTYSQTATLTGLQPNTTYELRVQAVAPAGSGSAFALMLPTATFAAAPSSAAASFSLSSAAVSWSASGNPGGSVYELRLSTDAFATVNGSLRTTSVSAAWTGLQANTTYYLASRALGHGGAYTAASSTAGATRAADPSAVGAAGVWLTSASWAWGAGGNAAGTIYQAQLSTDSFATVSASSQTLSVGATFFALASNATYYLRVRAVSHGGAATAYIAGASTATAAAAPASLQPSSVSATGIVAAWGAGGNASGTLYQARLSTDSFATVNASSATRNLSADFVGLQSNTTYYLQVRALGHDGRATAYTTLPSTRTLLLSPAAAPPAFTSIGVSSAAVRWASGGNGAGTTYEAQLSTDAFSTVNLSSLTFNLSAAFGTGGFGPALLGGSTYYARVRTVSGSNASAFLSLGSAAALVGAPSAAQVAATSTAAATLSWTNLANGPGAAYRAQVSLDAFGSVAASSVTYGLSASFSGLAPNTTHYFRVQAVNPAGLASAFTSASASATFAAAPSSMTPFRGTTSLGSGWSDSGNPSSTVYQVLLSTDGYATLNVSTRTTALTIGFGTGGILPALRPNTTYYVSARALGHGGAYTAASATAAATMAATPQAPAPALVALTSASLMWSSAGNPAGTVYEAQASTDAFTTLSASSATLSNGATFFALASNATYYLRVRARSHGGDASAFAVAAATATRAADPVALQPSSVSASGVALAWASGGNAAGTFYQARVSSDSFATVNASSTTLNLSAEFTSLQSNTTYYFQVRALGHDGRATAFAALPTTTTLLLPPSAPAQPFVSVQLASVAFQWGNGGNGAGTLYQAQLSTNGFATVNAASATYNLSALFGTGGFGPALRANTTYYARVRTASASNASAWVTLGSSATPAAAPLSPALLAVASTTISLDWQPNGNPEPGTGYEVWADLASGFTSPTATRVSSSAAVLSSLTPGATYYLKARALGHNGAYTSFTAALSTATLPPAPGPTGPLYGSALGRSSITWNWSGADLASGYRLYRASDPASMAGTVGGSPFILTGLSTNTAYGLVIAGFNGSGDGPLSAPTTIYTLAAPPAGSAASQVQGTSATVSWTLNTNPVQTAAEIQRSTDNAVFAVVAAASATAYTDTSLIGCTTYYFRVRNRNGDGLATAFDSVVQFKTLASTPAAAAGLAAESLAGSRITLSWSASPTEGVTGYRLYGDGGTGVVSYGAPLAVLTSTETSFTTGVLASSAAYTFALRARHRCGVEETSGVLAQAAAAAVLPNARAAVRSPSAGKKLSGDRVTIVGELSLGSAQSVRFEYKASSDPASGWRPISTVTAGQANPDAVAPYFVHWDVSGLDATFYDLRAVAYDLGGTPDPSPSAVTVQVYPADPDSAESLVSGRIRKQMKVSNGGASDIRGSDTGESAARIVLPAGALSTSSATATLIVGAALPAPPPDGAADAGLSLDISLSNGQTALLGSALLEFYYPDANGDGIVDGTGVSAQDLKIFTYNAAAGAWQLEGATVVDAANKRIIGTTPHFSVFAAFPQATVVALDRVRVYPVPFIPYGPNPDEGRPFVSGDTATGIIFDNLPAAVTIRIYTLTGGLVAEFSTLAGTGRLQWDARNGDGRMAASGGYLAVITSPGQRSVVKRLAIIR